MKSVEEIIKRAVALISFCDRCAHEEEMIDGRFYSLDVRENQRKIVYDWLKRIGYDKYLTTEENEIFNRSVSINKDFSIANKSVLYESIQPLLWAIGLERKISDYYKFVLKDFHATLMIGRNFNFKKIIKNSNLVDKDKIEKQRDIAMLWNWRSKVYPRIINEDIDKVVLRTFKEDLIENTKIRLCNDIPRDFLALGKPYRLLAKDEIAQLEQIAIWRQHALEWILSEEEWDDVPISI